MHYLIVRTPDTLQNSLQRFTQKSYDAKGLSVTNIQFLSPDMSVINQHKDFIFTSNYGVQSLARLFKPTPLDTAFCVGMHTAEYAKKSGFRHIITPPQHHATALAECVIQDYQISKKSYIYAAGVHRKPHLETILRNYNIPLTPVVLYDAVAIDFLDTQMIDFLTIYNPVIICFSARTAHILYHLMHKSYIKSPYEWHIVGKQTDSYCQGFITKNMYFYDTPQKLYDIFGI